MFHGDIRQIISYVQLSFKTVSHDFTLNMHLSDSKAKDSSVMSNHFDAIRKLMNRSEFTKMSIRDRLDCFFIDSDKVPIMVHENYMNSVKKCGNLKRNDFHRLVQATEGFVIGDQLDRTIRKSQ